MMEAYQDQLKEAGRLSSEFLVTQQKTDENKKIKLLNKELAELKKRRKEALDSGKIKKNSEEWRAMQDEINNVTKSIAETTTNVLTLEKAIKEITWDKWEKVHDAVKGVNNELEFLRELINEDDMFKENGTITNKGIEAYGLLAAEYDIYYAEAQKYAKERAETQKQLNKDPYNQDLVDKVKELTEAEQDAILNAHKMKDAMVDVAENGIKKQIDYVKKLIDKYTDLLEAQKDQQDYARKVSDQQKEINKLEKEYRAVANDTSEEGRTRRQKLKDQLEQAKQGLKDTQEERRISETKDMLSEFEESFEDFLNDKLKNIEKIVQDGINIANKNAGLVRTTINTTAKNEGYKLSGTLKDILNTAVKNNSEIASYFQKGFTDTKPLIASIDAGIKDIIAYYDKAQAASEAKAHKDATGSSVYNGTYYKDNGTVDTSKNGLVKDNGKYYYFKNGKAQTGWQTISGSKYYFNSNGQAATGFKTIGNKKYYFDSTGKQVTKAGFHTIGKEKYYFNSDGTVSDKTGWLTVNGKKYYLSGGKVYKNSWHTENGKKYYFDANGYMVTGTKHINGKVYVFNSNGVLNDQKSKDLQAKEKNALANAQDALNKAQANYRNAEAEYAKNPTSKTAQVNLDKARNELSKAQTKLQNLKQYGKGVSFSPKNQLAWTNENGKSEAIIRKSDGAILTPLNRGDSVIPNGAMKNLYQALTNPEKYLKQYTTPDVKIIQGNTGNQNNSPANVNIQFIANGVQDATKFANDLMNNKKIEKWIQEITLGQVNGNNSYRKYSYALR